MDKGFTIIVLALIILGQFVNIGFIVGGLIAALVALGVGYVVYTMSKETVGLIKTLAEGN